MKIFLAGATGRVAKSTIEGLVRRGHTVYAGARNPEQVKSSEFVIPVHLDLHDPVEELEALVEGCDAVYFLAGSRGKDLLQTDAFGAVKLIQATERAGISRFVMLSFLFSLRPEKWEEDPGLRGILNYDIAKFFADKWLVNNTELNYTIVQPGFLKEGEGTGNITLFPRQAAATLIPDVAEVFCEVLERENTYESLVPFTSGETPVVDALELL